LPVGKDEAQVLFGYNLFRDDLDTNEDSTEIGDPTEIQQEFIDTKDQDWFGTLAYTANLSSLVSVKFGVDGRIKTRDFSETILVAEVPDPLEVIPGLGALISRSDASIPTSRQIGTFSRTSPSRRAFATNSRIGKLLDPDSPPAAQTFRSSIHRRTSAMA
jgi:hypothetical protein